MPPEGSKGALEGPKSFKFLRARAQTTVFYDNFDVDRPPGEDGRILHLSRQKHAFGAGHSTVFAKWCSYAGERLKMALKVRESAKLGNYIWSLKFFRPSRAPLDPSGGKSDHLKALICW